MEYSSDLQVNRSPGWIVQQGRRANCLANGPQTRRGMHVARSLHLLDLFSKTQNKGIKMNRMKIGLIILGTMATVGLIVPAFPAAGQESPGQKQEKADKAQQPFHGKVDSVDAAAKTLTVEGKLIYIANSTKLTKAGKAIMLSDIRTGDQVHGTTRQTFDGKTEAITVKVGPQDKENEQERK